MQVCCIHMCTYNHNNVLITMITAGTEYWLLVLSPKNSLPPDKILVVVSISPSPECQQVSF